MALLISGTTDAVGFCHRKTIHGAVTMMILIDSIVANFVICLTVTSDIATHSPLKFLRGWQERLHEFPFWETRNNV